MVQNFNAGPAKLPDIVMERAQESFKSYHSLGYGIIEASHRSPEFQEVIEQAEENIRTLLFIPDSYSILFLQGGASTQFSMIPMNLLQKHTCANYALTGSWSIKAHTEAQKLGTTHISASSKEGNFDRIPEFAEWETSPNAAYLHITSNNTIFGTQYHKFPESQDHVPLIADMSSDILSRRIPISEFGLIYAGAQKNLGPSGVTLVILKKELAERAPTHLPSMLGYTTHIKSKSLYNTPPTFAIYLIKLVTDWIIEQGGLEDLEKRNIEKSQLLYRMIDQDKFYSCPAHPQSRSYMNVCFRLPTQDLEEKFIAAVKKEGMIGLKGHRSVGGLRASIYNAMPLSGVKCLTEVMTEFKQRHG